MATYKRYLKYLKYVNGEPTDEYKQGEYIDTSDYDSLSDCEGGAIYEWRDDESQYICDGWHSYYRAYRYKSLDGGQTWTKTGSSYLKGSLKEWESAECGWKLLQEWRDTGETVCYGYDLAKEQLLYESRDMGETWKPVEPAQFKYVLVEAYNEKCVLQSDPLTYEIDSDSVNLNLLMHPYDESITPRYGDYSRLKGYNKKVFYKFWIQWDEEESVVPITYNTSVDSDSVYAASFAAAAPYRVGSHNWAVKAPHIIKVWGYVHTMADPDKPYKVLNWGTADYAAFNDYTAVNVGGLSAYPTRYSTYYALHLLTVNLGSNLLEWAEDNDWKLGWNESFTVHSDKITFLPQPSLVNYNTETLDVSDCPNLLEIPQLQLEGVFVNERAWKKVKATNCISLKETPMGLWRCHTTVSPNAQFNCDEAFKGCINLEKINGPIYVSSATSMFEGCENLLVGSDADIAVGGYALKMFKDCIKITEQIPISNGKWIDSDTILVSPAYAINYTEMFANTGITSVDLDVVWDKLNLSNISWYSPSFILTGMFKGCKDLKRVSGELPIDYVREDSSNMYSVDTAEMFQNCSSLTETSAIFRRAIYLPISMTRMFSGCDLRSLPDDFFNYEAKRYTSFSSSYLTASLMFAGNSKLENYPSLNGVAVWYYPSSFYVNALIMSTYAFIGCPLIEELVPVQWGGTKGGLPNFKPMILELGEGGVISPSYGRTTNPQYLGAILSGTTDLVVICEDGNYALYAPSFGYYSSINESAVSDLYIPNGVKARVYISKEGGGISMSSYPSSSLIGPTVKVYDFGSHVSLGTSYYLRVCYYGNAEDSTYIKGFTLLSIGSYYVINNDSVPRVITDDFWKGCMNVNTLSIPKCEVSEDLKLSQYMPKLSQVNGWSADLKDYIETFAGCSELIKVDCMLPVEGKNIKGMFKDCPKLNYIWSLSGLGATSMEEFVMNDTSYKNDIVSLANPNYNCNNFIRANCNTGIETTNYGPLYFNPSGSTYLLAGRDYTECYKDCSQLRSVSCSVSIYVDKTNNRSLQLRLNLTRCFEGCENLKTANLQCYMTGYKDGTNYSGSWTMYLWDAMREYPELFDVKYEGCFRGCTLISNYDQIPDDWK